MSNSKRNTVSKTKKVKKLSVFNRLSPGKLRLVLFVVGFAFLGAFLLFQTFAGTHDSGREIDIVNRTNSHRGSHGIAGLNRSKCLTLVAREWAQYMGDRNDWRHQTEAEWKGKVQHYCGNSNVYGGENIAQGQNTAEWVMRDWLNSSGHHRNIDDTRFNHIGVAGYIDNYGRYNWVQIFAECRGCGGEWTAPVPETGGNTSAPAATEFSNPAAVSRASGIIDTFVRGTDNRLYHKWYNNGWSGWEGMGGQLAGGPAATSWGSGRIDVFVRGTDNKLYTKYWNGSWQPSINGFVKLDYGGIITSAPAAESWGPNRIDVFARGGDNALYHLWWDGARWNGWEYLGGQLGSAPAVTSQGAGKLDVVVRGTDGGLWRKSYNNGWGGWTSMGGQLQGAPSIVSWGPGRLDIFVRGTDNGVWTRGCDNYNCNNWWKLGGGATTSGPAASSWAPGRIDIFVRGTDGQMWHDWFDGQWRWWEPLAGGLN